MDKVAFEKLIDSLKKFARPELFEDGTDILDELYTDWHQAIKSNRFTVRPNGKMIAKSTSGR